MYLEDDFIKYFNMINEHEVMIEQVPLNEKSKELTLYDLRAFYTVMADVTTDSSLKSMLKSMIKTIAKMEVFKKKVPPIMRVKSPSPTVRSYSKN